MTYLELEQKFWYRMAKVIYIGAYIVAILLVVGLGYTYKPYEYVNSARSTIQCANGSRYTNGSLISIIDSVDTNSLDDYSLRILCAQGRRIEPYSLVAYQNKTILVPKNYTLSYAYNTNGSWKDASTFWFWGIGVITIAFLIIKKVFLYIVTGTSYQIQA